MAKVVLTVDDDIKAPASMLANELGLSLSAVTNMFYRQMVYEHGLPFLPTRVNHTERKASIVGVDKDGYPVLDIPDSFAPALKRDANGTIVLPKAWDDDDE